MLKHTLAVLSRGAALTWLLSAFSPIAYGQDKPSEDQGGSRKSFQNRAESNVQLLFKPIGFYEYGGSGASVGYVFDSYNVAEFSYFRTVSAWEDNPAYISNYVDGTWRHFFGNSFNMRLGLTYRRKQIDYLRRDLHDENYDVRIKKGTLGTNFSIGHQWQLGKFLIGCDWVGFYLPLVDTGEGRLSGDTDTLSPSTKKELRHDADKVNLYPSMLIVALHLGMAL